KPRKIIETGTYRGTGTTRIIASALRELNLKDAIFHSIEVNPTHLASAKENLARTGLDSYVRLHHGLSVPRSLLPSIQDIERQTVQDIEFDDIYVDHKDSERARLYFLDTHFESAR